MAQPILAIGRAESESKLNSESNSPGPENEPSRPDECEQVLSEWNHTQADYAREACVHELVEAIALAAPERIAAMFESEEITYQELNARANQLGRHLRQLGVEANKLVGIFVERSLDMLVALAAVLKAGGAYVPLDPAYPADRIAYMIEDSGIQVLITEEGLKAQLPATMVAQPRIANIDRDWNAISGQSMENLGRTASAEDLAYVIYTSGSTGKPKGVMVPHRAINNLVSSMRREPGFTEADRIIALTTLSFDMAEVEIWLPLSAGGRMVIASRELASDGKLLAELVKSSQATVVQATPATWRLLVDAGWQGSKKLKLLCGGEALSPALAETLLKNCGELWNMYGPTETTVWSSASRVEAGKSISIGHPIANTRFYVLDGERRPASIGVAGELYIAGDGLANGYLHQPELTAEKFVADPFARDSGERLYRTGDLARCHPDGEIEFLGRVDHQVKLRGHRIELGEIEASLAKHPAVHEAVVVAREDEPGRKRLVAYIGAPQPPAILELRRQLRAALPEYMVPSAFIMLPALPHTPNGKIDRARLTAPDRSLSGSDGPFVAPRTQTEKKLASIWEKELGICPIGVTDDYFDLGAESLVTGRVCAQIAKRFGRVVPAAMIFEAPTIEQLAAVLSRKASAAKEELGKSLMPIRTSGTRTPLFFLDGGVNESLFFHTVARHMGGDQPVYELQAQGSDGGTARMSRVEDVAEHYLEQLRAVQPHGPYAFAGYCFGMFVAFEMAQRLLAKGEQVAFLASINGALPEHEPRTVTAGVETAPGTAPGNGLLAKLSHGLGWRWGALRRAYRQRRSQYYVSRGLPIPLGMRALFFAEMHEAAGKRYQIKKYPGDIFVFHSDRQYREADLGWAKYAVGQVHTYKVAGDYTPLAGDLARAIELALSQPKAENLHASATGGQNAA